MTENASKECIRLSKRLKSLRQARGFKTARSFASKLDIHENRYTRYERAEVEPDLELLVKFCSILQITPNDLLSETIEMASEPASAAMAASGFTRLMMRFDFMRLETNLKGNMRFFRLNFL